MKILPVRNNSQKIEAQIDKVQREIEEVEEKTNYTNNFQVKYLESEYAPYFAGHENGIIYDNEKVVRLSYQITKVDQSVPRKKWWVDIMLSTPRESWNHFMKDKFPLLEDMSAN